MNIFQVDVSSIIKPICGEYCFSLNTDDNFDPELPLLRNHAHGGTMILWKRSLDPFITVLQTPCSSFLPILLNIPCHPVSVHISLYLPTSGKEPDFLDKLSNLSNLLDKILDKYSGATIFIRGDSNVNPKNETRNVLFQHFQDVFKLNRVPLCHNTYHHFVGDGLFDSEIDVIMNSKSNNIDESVTDIICKHLHPEIDSHHDLILSEFSLPFDTPPPPPEDLLVAPRVEIDRIKVCWSDEGIIEYEKAVSPHLRRLRESWSQTESKSLFNILLSSTNSILSKSASCTNETVDIGRKHVIKSVKKPPEVQKAQTNQKKANNSLSSLLQSRVSSPKKIRSARLYLKETKKNLRKSVRHTHIQANIKRDQQLNKIAGENPSQVYSFIKSSRNSSSTQIQKLSVAGKSYQDEMVPDGFFDSMSRLKSCNYDDMKKDPMLTQQFSDYENILKLLPATSNIPPISRIKSDQLLQKIRQNVKDLNSITAQHYTNAGEEGLQHFNFLLNCVISDVSLAEVAELNIAHGVIIFKGHNKDKNSDRSYRTISTCPLIAKSLDMYVKGLYVDILDKNQASTQYFGTGSSHELASLLVTEGIQFSLYNSDKPIFLLFVDALSAFDKVLPQLLVRNLFFHGINGDTLSYIKNRLTSRSTVYEWDKTLMGPARDLTGLEQGGVPSGDFYKVHNNEQIEAAQKSKQGVDIGSSVISAAAQADDVLLTTNDIYSLQNLIDLTSTYCKRFNVHLSPEKTKLLVICSKSCRDLAEYSKSINPINIDGVKIEFSTSAEHVGVLRSTTGNLPNILDRVAAHKKALGSVLAAGLARGHRGNLAAALKVEKLYACPVLMSGLASLFMTKSEVNIIANHYKSTLENIQKFHKRTPAPVIFFMAGSLPGSAILHIRQLTLFSMICRLPEDPLNLHARYILCSTKKSTNSWFHQIRNLCLQYQLPHPVELLDNPPQKDQFKRKLKSQVTSYWESKLREECSLLPSLRYFNPAFMSLANPHPLWTTAGSSPFEVNKACVQAKMLSGRFRTENLCRFWSSNKKGFCLAPQCENEVEDIEHILTRCKSLEGPRKRLHSAWMAKATTDTHLHQLIIKVLASTPDQFCQFVLDPSNHPEVISLTQKHGESILKNTFYLTRTWCHTLYKERLKVLGRFELL